MVARMEPRMITSTISLSLLVLPSDAALTFDVNSIGGLGLIGAPLAALLGFVLTPNLVRSSWRKAAGLGIAMGVGAAYLGVLELALLSLIASLVGFDASSGLGDDVPLALFIAVIGLPFGTFVLPITIPC